MIRTVLACLLIPTAVFSDDITVENPMVPLAPPGAMAHAAFMTILNTGDVPKQLVGVTAEGYAMAHVHKTEVTNDVATMVSVDLIEIAPDQRVVFETGGLHVMLMKPEAAKKEGDTVTLSLEFSDGTTQEVTAMVMKMKHGHKHGSHGGHGS